MCDGLNVDPDAVLSETVTTVSLSADPTVAFSEQCTAFQDSQGGLLQGLIVPS